MSLLIQYRGGAIFARTCPKCNRFVRADKTILANDEGTPHPTKPNARCKVHGRVRMPFGGYSLEDDSP